MGKHSIGFYESAPRRRAKLFLKIFVGLVAFFVLAGILVSYGFIKQLEGRLRKDSNAIKEVEKVVSKPSWDKPINLLVLGSDSRGEKNARADTIIIVSINPPKERVYVISIPRDLRVEIPGKGYNKINVATHLGGAELIIRTVENFTDLPIHHYLETDFQGFQKMVDALGGVEIYVDKAIKDNTPGYQMGIPAGYQKMDGSVALNYVRYRHDALGDFGRIQRQQKFLKALMDKILRFSSWYKIPSLANILADNTETDLAVSEMIEVGNFLRGVDKENIEMVSLPGVPKTIKSVSYVIPDEKAVNTILTAVKLGVGIEATTAAKLKVKVTPEDVCVKILNGSGKKGVARTCQAELKEKGFKVLEVGDADRADYSHTVIQYLPGQYYKALEVAKHFCDSSVVPITKARTKADVVIVLGQNYYGSPSAVEGGKQ